MNANEKRLTNENAELRRKLEDMAPKPVAAKMEAGDTPSARKEALEALSAVKSAERARRGDPKLHGHRADRDSIRGAK